MEITEEEQVAYSAREHELKAGGIGTGVRVYCSPACVEKELACNKCRRLSQEYIALLLPGAQTVDAKDCVNG